MANKITKREVIVGIMNGTIAVDSEIATNFFNHEIELLDKKKANKVASKVQVANVGIKDEIVATLVAKGTPMRVTDIIKANENFAEFSNQKVSALLKQLVEENRVVKFMDKKVSTFKAL